MASHKQHCVVLGGGGHAKVVIEAIRAQGGVAIVGVLDPNPALQGRSVLGCSVMGGDELIADLAAQGVTHFAIGVGSIGDSRVRERLFDFARAAGMAPLSVRHPSVICSPTATVGLGCQLMAGAILNAECRVGENVIVNSGAVVEHDCVIDPHAHVATGARLASGVHVGCGAHIGAGAVLRQGIVIGPRAVVGIGAAVVRDVPAGSVVGGVPARPLARIAGAAATR